MSQALLSPYATNIFPRKWTWKDRLRLFPQRKATVMPSAWVEELMAKRFGALIICGPCGIKYRDGIRRWGYFAHENMKAQGNACDFCKRVDPYPVPIWLKEEHRYPTATEHAEQSRRFGVAGAPHLYDRTRGRNHVPD